MDGFPTGKVCLSLVAVFALLAPATHAGKTNVARSGGRLVADLPIKVRCPADADGACHATANLSGRSGGGIAALLGSASRSLAPGEKWQVRVNLTPTAGKVLREEGEAKALVLVALEKPDGKTTVKTAEVTLRRPAERGQKGSGLP